MISLDEFEEMVLDIADTLPEEFYRELNGGVMVQPAHMRHPESVGNELSIMGQYVRHPHLGRYVVLYYGSFMAVYGHYDKEQLQVRVRKTILHEFRHHLESLAGEKGLEVEDAIQIAEYKAKKAKNA